MSRAAEIFNRATHRLFDHFGEEAMLGNRHVIVVLTENVQQYNEYGAVAGRVTTATFHTPDDPREGDTLTVRGRRWRVDKIEEGDDLITTCVLRRTHGV